MKGLDSNGLEIVINIIGWLYFIAWSLSFYPQVWDNWRRKSVVGFSLDYLNLNVLGYASYSIYNCALYFNKEVQIEYLSSKGYPLPVKASDVVFALHALLLTLVTAGQSLLYERAGQTVHPLTYLTSSAMYITEYVLILLIATSSIASSFNVLRYVEMCSYVKLGVTFVKYVPQAWSNYRRQSTVGWAIGNVLLDLTGGLLSLLQQFLMVLNSGSWTVFTGNWAKTGLALFSIFFDLLFIFQHYVLYTDRHDLALSSSSSAAAADSSSPSSSSAYQSLSSFHAINQNSEAEYLFDASDSSSCFPLSCCQESFSSF